MRILATGLYADAATAKAAVEGLVRDGFDYERIQAVELHQRRRRLLKVEHRTGMPTGAAIGSGLGAVLGSALMTLAATGVIAWPMFGAPGDPVVLALLKGAILGFGAGAVTGIVAGMVHGRTELVLGEQGLQGVIFIGVLTTAPHWAEAARAVLTEAGATRVWPRKTPTTSAAQAG